MIRAVEAFIKNDHKLVPFHTNALYRQTKTLVDEVQVRLLEEDKDKSPIIALFPDTNIEKIIITNLIMSLFISTMNVLNYSTRNKWKKWETKTGIQARKTFL